MVPIFVLYLSSITTSQEVIPNVVLTHLIQHILQE